MIIVSWWNSDRFLGVRQPRRRGVPTYLANFHRKGHESEKVEPKWKKKLNGGVTGGGEGGGRAARRRYHTLRSINSFLYSVITNKRNVDL